MNFITQLIFLTGLISFPHSPSVITSKGPVKFYLDTATFKITPEIERFELYYLIDLSTLDTSAVKKLSYDFRLETKGKKPVKQKWTQELGKRRGRNYLIDQISILLAPGTYHLKFTITDLNNNNKGEVDTTVVIKAVPDTSLAVSDVEFLWDVKKDTIPNFFKYGLSFIPNPVRTYSPEKDTLLYTYEIYSPESATVVLNSLIFSEDGKPLLRNKPEIIKFRGKHVGIGAILLEGLKDEGSYNLVLDFADITHNRHLKKSIPFYYTFGEKQIPPQLMDYISFIDYIATPQELKEYKKIKDERGRYLFLKKFWAKRDPNPKTPENEFLEEFIMRVREADRKYSIGKTKGRYTDRGRILIKYGEPDQIKRISLEGKTPDREEWYYYSQNWKFIFVDIQNNGNYILVYSSNREEPSLPDWKKYIPEEETSNFHQ